jgi:drug/metabolite transporter (DMT)-like permease
MTSLRVSNRQLTIQGHLLALVTSFIWGITFVSTKLLLRDFTPLGIMLLRFLLAYVALWIMHPKHYKIRSFKEELVFFLAGLTGVTGYFYLENTAMIYTSVSNTGLILASAPLFVAIVTHFFTKDEKFHLNLLIGFLVAIVGIALIIFNGQVYLELNPLGDILALLAAVMWAFYSLSVKYMDGTYSPLFITRRTFFYGIFAGVLLLLATEGTIAVAPIFKSYNWFHLAFLGLLASATCYVLWSKSIRIIGAVKTSNYIYLMPVFTMIASAIILNEKITALMLIGCGFILLGVYLSRGPKAS